MSATSSELRLRVLLLALFALSCSGLDGLRPEAPRDGQTVACNDGIDDDGDGLTDFPNDPGCESDQDPSELDPVEKRACSDGIDNDHDGKIDFDTNHNGIVDGNEDIGCESASDDGESNAVLPACADGADNDGDGLTDFPNDPQCSSRNDTDEAQ